MRSLSIWAKHNPWKARFVIVACHLVLCALAFYIGTALSDLDIELPQVLLFLVLLIFLITAGIYPARKNGSVSVRVMYIRRKMADCIIAACSFFIVCCLVNNYQQGTISAILPLYAATNSNAPAAGKPTAEEILASLSHRDKNSLTRAEKRVLKKEFKHQLKVYIKAKATGQTDSAEKALYIILAILGAGIVIYLLAALACTIACAGSEALAVVLFILGSAAVLIALVMVIIYILRGKKTVPTERSPKTNTGSIHNSLDSNI